MSFRKHHQRCLGQNQNAPYRVLERRILRSHAVANGSRSSWPLHSLAQLTRRRKEEDVTVYDAAQTALNSGFRVWRPGVSTSAVTLSPTSETWSAIPGTSSRICGTLSPTNGRGRAATRANARQIMAEKPTHEVKMIAITMNKMKARCVPLSSALERQLWKIACGGGLSIKEKLPGTLLRA